MFYERYPIYNFIHEMFYERYQYNFIHEMFHEKYQYINLFIKCSMKDIQYIIYSWNVL